MNRDHIDSWLARKLTRKPLALVESRTFAERYTRIYGPRADFAVVTLSASPAADFSFLSNATWPSTDNYDNAILDGILDVFLCAGVSGIGVGGAFVVDSIEWHDVDSNAVAYYHAAKRATEKIIADNLSIMEH